MTETKSAEARVMSPTAIAEVIINGYICSKAQKEAGLQVSLFQLTLY